MTGGEKKLLQAKHWLEEAQTRNLTAHTIISTPAVWLPFEEQGQSVAGWLQDAISGNLQDYGIDLLDKVY